MKGNVFNGIQTGYVVWEPEASLPELKHAGEEWAFPEYSTSVHSHPFHELHLQLSGRTEWESAQGILTVEENMLVAMAPGVRHQMRPITQRAHHFIYCSIDLAAELKKSGLPGDLPLFQQPSFLIRNAKEFIPPFTSLSQEIRQNRPHREQLIGLSLRAIALLLHRFATLSIPPAGAEPEESSPLHPLFNSRLMTRMKTYVEQHLSEKLSIPQLAAHLRVSRSALFEASRRELGKSPAVYQMERRMEVARGMLQTPELPLTQIAHELGFSSSQHFSTAFRKHFGVAPSHYRAKSGDA